jgi:type IX secretion system PorP/SprF family membrane protein
MINKSLMLRLGVAATLALGICTANAQDIHFTQFDTSPLTVNPAFTGMFNGQVRACGIYRNQWSSVTVPYVTYGASVDLPIFWSQSGYLAGGLQLFDDKAGDGNLTNFTGMVSLAYHLTTGSARDNDQRSDLAVGIQGGYASKSIDLSKLYFGDEFVNGTFVQGTTQEYQEGLGHQISYYLVNAGISYSHSFSRNFAFTLGAGANNLNQPADAIEKKQNSETGLDMRYTGELGLDLGVGDRLSLRPAVLYQYQASATEMIAGNEFHYVLGDHTEPDLKSFTTAVFLGGWYRTGDAIMITAGLEIKGVRIGFGYDYNMSTLNAASNGNGGFELAIKYLAPWPSIYGGTRSVPCIRF